MNLPEGTHLAYYDYRATWYPSRERAVGISAAFPGGGCAWNFTVTEKNLGTHGTAIKVEIFEDAFAAFTQIPGFFAALATMASYPDLDTVILLLKLLGAADETAREAPGGAEASAAEKAEAVIRNHPAGTRDYKAALALAEAILAETRQEAGQ